MLVKSICLVVLLYSSIINIATCKYYVVVTIRVYDCGVIIRKLIFINRPLSTNVRYGEQSLKFTQPPNKGLNIHSCNFD